MKKFLLLLLIIFSANATARAAENPSCVLMKFTDDTRFDLVESAASLSDLVMEKLIASKKFRLMETNPIEENMEIKLYNEKLRDLKFLEEAVKKAEEPAEIPISENPEIETPEDLKVDAENLNITKEKSVEESATEDLKIDAENLNVIKEKIVEESATEDLKINAENLNVTEEKIDEVKKVEPRVIDLTPLFEGVGFDEKRAQSISTAQTGQIIDPEITAAIGKAHNAEYLIQGTIINLGTGNWWNEDFENISNALNTFSGLANTSVPLGMVGDVLSGLDVGKIGVGVQCDLRVIKAETGEVVWSKRVVGVHDQVSLSLSVISIGNRKLNNNFYAKAMDKAAQKIVDALVADSKNIFQ